jgi:hypothetical protein
VYDTVNQFREWYNNIIGPALDAVGLNGCHRLLCRPEQYSDKIEIFYPSQGSYVLQPLSLYKGADFHHVTVDIQLLTSDGVYCHNNHAVRKHVPQYKPTFAQHKTIKLSEIDYPIMDDPKTYLSQLYGYTGPYAELDSVSGLYRKRSNLK